MRTLFSGERIFEVATIVISTTIVVSMLTMAVNRMSHTGGIEQQQRSVNNDIYHERLVSSSPESGFQVDRSLKSPLPSQQIQRRGMVDMSAMITPNTVQHLPLLRGDLNCDGVVDALDTKPFLDSVLIGDFNEKADLNGDNVVDLLDLQHCNPLD